MIFNKNKKEGELMRSAITPICAAALILLTLSNAHASCTISSINAWKTGFVMHISVKAISSPLSDWTASIETSSAITIERAWNAQAQKKSNRVEFRPLSQDTILRPGESAQFGFKAKAMGQLTKNQFKCIFTANNPI